MKYAGKFKNCLNYTSLLVLLFDKDMTVKEYINYWKEQKMSEKKKPIVSKETEQKIRELIGAMPRGNKQWFNGQNNGN